MEPGIKPIVDKLKDLGIRTVSSCEGHRDKQIPDAYVAFVTDNYTAIKLAKSIEATLRSLHLHELGVDLNLSKVMYDQEADGYADCCIITIHKFAALKSVRSAVAEEIAKCLRV